MDYWRLGKAWFSEPWAFWALPSRPPKSAGPRRAFTRFAFTLAETLITLGIIGIVAALTMPALVANYQKKTLETRIKKFCSVINQAVNTKIAKDGDLDGTMLTTANNPDQAEEFFNINYAPYMKIVNTKKLPNGFAVAFPDGSGMFVYIRIVNPGGPTAYINWCVDYKKSLFEGEGLALANTDAKSCFLFNNNGATDIEYVTRITPVGGDVRETAKQGCTNGSYIRCPVLLQIDGWEIAPDYPW